MSISRKSLHARLDSTEPMMRCKLNECLAACCYDGTWVDTAKVADILANAEQILPHMPENFSDPVHWFRPEKEVDKHLPSGEVMHTTVHANPQHPYETSCVFLRGDYKCALQTAGAAAEKHPWHFKPYYCILHPLELDEDDQISLDETEALLKDTRSCLREAAENVPLIETFAEEIEYLAKK